MLTLLSQTTTTVDPAAAAGALVGSLISIVIALVVVGLPVGGFFVKAGEARWQGFVPLYNTFVMLKIVGRPWWWFLLLFVPVVNVVVLILLMNDLSRSFGHGTGFTVGLLLLSLVFFYVLWLDSSTYRGPAALTAPTAAPAQA
ncbi:DUF5684 domain-containing protein [Cellulomonas sp. SLBN-39]|uniref:DUF5684 domain-containing protein n=1 Tax=Cellulomonas sp. SLBN-39 TaxID=2768446 RepID=UPI0011519E96|nr:DUF5684 domain-containing protein [Cellulomonas sp. SLBN-39]TQL01051.1 hypothetical protein FBY24_0093 [Cellulomonas sp. SLBN-39]